MGLVLAYCGIMGSLGAAAFGEPPGRAGTERKRPATMTAVQWKAAAFVRWHEPDDARVSSPDL